MASGNGYSADIQFGGGKDTINELFEQDLNDHIPASHSRMKSDVRKAQARQQAKEKRTGERVKAHESAATVEAALQFQKNRISDLSKYTK